MSQLHTNLVENIVTATTDSIEADSINSHKDTVRAIPGSMPTRRVPMSVHNRRT